MRVFEGLALVLLMFSIIRMSTVLRDKADREVWEGHAKRLARKLDHERKLQGGDNGSSGYGKAMAGDWAASL